MRAVLYLLVLANVAFFAWARWIDVPIARARPAATTPHLPLLELVKLPDPATMRCRSLGPFTDPAAAAAVIDALRKRGVEPQQRRVEASIADGYWVHIDLPDKDSQRRAFARLIAAGVHDAAMMTQPADAGRISVGVFADQAHAVHRAEQVRALGFKPVLELHQRPGEQQWLDMYLHRDAPEPAVTDLEGTPAAQGSGTPAQDSGAPQFTDCPTRPS